MTKPKYTARLPGQAIACGWCGHPIPVRATGRLPKWCSDACRHRAWEQRRAATSGLAAVQVIDRVIEVEKEVHILEKVEVTVQPRRGEWPGLLTDLAHQIDNGRLYDRDLPDLEQALQEVITALGRRRAWNRKRRY